MKHLIEKIKHGGAKRVVVVGDVILDEYIVGSSHYISPEAPVPVVNEERREWMLGGAGNVAAHCKAIGLSVDLIGIVNNEDDSGVRLCSLLEEAGMLPDGLVFSTTRITSNKTRIIAGNQQCLRLDRQDSHSLTVHERSALMEKLDARIQLHDIILIADNAKGVIDETLIDYIMTLAHKYRCIVVAEPKGPDFGKYAQIHYIKTTMTEFGNLIKFFGLSSRRSLIDNGRALCSLLSLEGLFITLGGNGIRFISPGDTVYSKSLKREVCDITGAGDTVLAYIGAGFAYGLGIGDMMRLANNAATIAVSHSRTYVVGIDELIDCEKEQDYKIINDWARLKIEVDWQRADGSKVIIVYGQFDGLSASHLRILKEAKRWGDILIVAVGQGSLERQEILAGLTCVDFVTLFEQETPVTLISYFQPDFLMASIDHQEMEIVGYQVNDLAIKKSEGLSSLLINKSVGLFRE